MSAFPGARGGPVDARAPAAAAFDFDLSDATALIEQVRGGESQAGIPAKCQICALLSLPPLPS